MRGALAQLDRADRIDRVLIAEAQAAEAYWDAWVAVPMVFAERDRVPDHWRTFGARRSPLTLGPRNAANPLNAILNYLYTLRADRPRPRSRPRAISLRRGQPPKPRSGRDGAGAPTR